MNTSVYTKVQTVRDFYAFYDLTWRKGVTGVMSQKFFIMENMQTLDLQKKSYAWQ